MTIEASFRETSTTHDIKQKILNSAFAYAELKNRNQGISPNLGSYLPDNLRAFDDRTTIVKFSLDQRVGEELSDLGRLVNASNFPHVYFEVINYRASGNNPSLSVPDILDGYIKDRGIDANTIISILKDLKERYAGYQFVFLISADNDYELVNEFNNKFLGKFAIFFNQLMSNLPVKIRERFGYYGDRFYHAFIRKYFDRHRIIRDIFCVRKNGEISFFEFRYCSQGLIFINQLSNEDLEIIKESLEEALAFLQKN